MTGNPRYLVGAGYAIAMVLYIIPAADMLIATWAPQPAAPQWRFAALGLIGNSLTLPLLATFLAAFSAHWLGHRRILLGISAFCAVMVLLLLSAAFVFSLDARQLLASVRAEMQQPFSMAAMKSTAQYALAALVYGWLAFAGYEAAGRSREHARSSASRNKKKSVAARPVVGASS
jgi:amino acid transporter